MLRARMVSSIFFFIVTIGIFGLPDDAYALSVSGSVNPTKIYLGENVGVSWSISGATSCSMRALVAGTTDNNFPTTSGSTVITAPARSETFSLSCTDGVSTQTVVAGFTVTSEITSFTASPSTIAAGASSTLSWTTKNAAQCYIGVDGTTIGGTQPPSGSYVVTPSSTKQYSLSCVDLNRGLLSDTRNQTVTVSGVSGTAPIANVSVNGVAGEGEEKSPAATAAINLGQSANVNWSSSNAVSCTFSSSGLDGQGVSGVVAPSGSIVVSPEAAGYKPIVLYCTNATGQNSSKKIIEIAVRATPSGGGSGGGIGGSCIPDNSCAVNTCTNQTCKNNCEQIIAGTKVCGGGLLSFSTDRATLSEPGQVTLSWETVAGTVACVASGAWSGNITPLIGSRTLHVDMTSSFYLNCSDATGKMTGEKRVDVVINSNCAADTSCAANFCTYEVCYDGCGGVVGGTKQCSQNLCTPDNSCTLTTPTGSNCINNCGQVVPGVQSSGPSQNPGQSPNPGQNSGPQNPTTGNTGPAASNITVSFGNIVGFSDVNGFLTRILSFLQGFIVTLAILFIIIGGFLYITSAGNDSQMETAKKCILGALIGLALGIAAPAFLKEIYTILGTNTTVPNGVGTTLSVLQIAENVLSFLLTIIGIIAIIMLIVGGIMYLTAAGNEDQLDKGKKIVKYSIIGILIALAALVLVRQVAGFFV